ncbi:MAG: hypothetical protein ACKVS9_15480 [Phycisphaerae bacterium]
MTMRIDVQDSDHVRLTDEATRLGVTPETLASVATSQFVQQPRPEIVRIVDELVTRNAALYRRLA